MSGNGKVRRETSAQTAAKFLELRARRRHRGLEGCCPRYAWGDGTHDLDCSRLYTPKQHKDPAK